jgi:hypothetical protein
MENSKYVGCVRVPYISKHVETDINGETVWYNNVWKNLLLKIKHFFIKPKYLNNTHKYRNKVIDSSLYSVIKINGDDNEQIS